MRYAVGIIWCGVVLLALGGHSRAALEFEAERKVVDVGPGDEKVEIVFPFKNTGNTPARVVSVISTCQCIDADAPKDDVPPGGIGEVHATFKVGPAQGTVEKGVVARIEENGVRRDLPLVVGIRVPDVMKVEPGTLVWTTGEDPVERSFLVRMLWKEPAKVLSVDVSRSEFTARIEEVELGKEYRVHVKPVGAVPEPLLGLIQIKTDSPFPKYRNPMAFIHVKKPGGG